MIQTVWDICSSSICQGNICPGNICPVDICCGTSCFLTSTYPMKSEFGSQPNFTNLRWFKLFGTFVKSEDFCQTLLQYDSTLLPHLAPSWIFSWGENLVSYRLQEGATRWHYSPETNHQPICRIRSIPRTPR